MEPRYSGTRITWRVEAKSPGSAVKLNCAPSRGVLSDASRKVFHVSGRSPRPIPKSFRSNSWVIARIHRGEWGTPTAVLGGAASGPRLVFPRLEKTGDFFPAKCGFG